MSHIDEPGARYTKHFLSQGNGVEREEYAEVRTVGREPPQLGGTIQRYHSTAIPNSMTLRKSCSLVIRGTFSEDKNFSALYCGATMYPAIPRVYLHLEKPRSSVRPAITNINVSLRDPPYTQAPDRWLSMFRCFLARIATSIRTTRVAGVVPGLTSCRLHGTK